MKTNIDKKYGLIIFDLDGTIANTVKNIGYNMNIVLEKNAYETHELLEYSNFLGWGINELTRQALPKEARKKEIIDRLVDQMMETYYENYYYGFELYDGVKDLLDYLSENRYKIAINTNKPQKITDRIAKSFFSDWPFEMIVGAKGAYPNKPDPAAAIDIMQKAKLKPSECLYVGDTEVDYQTAINAGIDIALCKWGFRQVKDLDKLGPNYLLDKPLDIINIV